MTDTFYIRDPILEGIGCSDAEKELINSPLVQRLKWVSQLSMVNQVYNGGTHSRFSHSLGAMAVAGQYMSHLLSTVTDKEFADHGINMDAKQRAHWIQLARVAGLLHDIGHGPFSHSFDHAVYQQVYYIEDGGHDIARLKLLDSPLLYPYLVKLGIWPIELIEIWGPESYFTTLFNDLDGAMTLAPMYSVIRSIVEGPLGADRIDFTRRDAYYVGMQHLGTVPASRIIQNSKLVFRDSIPNAKHQTSKGENIICVSYHAKCIYDIIRTLDGRLNMYESVYMHKTSMAATVLVELMMRLVCKPFQLIQMATDPNQFKRLTDHKFLGMISEVDEHHPTWDTYKNDILEAKRLYEMLMDRHLPKMDYEVHVTDFTVPFKIDDYVAKWYPNRDPRTFQIVKSRAISGISADKFDKYNITFHTSDSKSGTSVNGDNETVIFQTREILQSINYQVPIPPYYIVRGYTIPSKV